MITSTPFGQASKYYIFKNGKIVPAQSFSYLYALVRIKTYISDFGQALIKKFFRLWYYGQNFNFASRICSELGMLFSGLERIFNWVGIYVIFIASSCLGVKFGVDDLQIWVRVGISSTNSGVKQDDEDLNRSELFLNLRPWLAYSYSYQMTQSLP